MQQIYIVDEPLCDVFDINKLKNKSKISFSSEYNLSYDNSAFSHLPPGFHYSSSASNIHLSPEVYEKLATYSPWALQSIHQYLSQKSHLDSLSIEILDFYAFMLPTRAELMFRQNVFEHHLSIVRSIWPTSKVSLYGSLSTGLFLPNADFDITLFGVDGELNPYQYQPTPINIQRDCLLKLQIELVREYNRIECLPNATVPLIKYKDVQSGLEISTSINSTSGVINTFIVRSFLRKFPEARILVIVLKAFLLHSKLAGSYHGTYFFLLYLCLFFFM
jgi:DNA polymerase sigma